MNELLNLLKSSTNKSQMENYALAAIGRKNPAVASALRQCISSGQDAKTILIQAIDAGQINKAQFDQFEKTIRSIAPIAKLGISERDLDELRSAFSQSTLNYNVFRF